MVMSCNNDSLSYFLKNLHKTYEWFCRNFTEKLHKSLQEFFEADCNIKLFSISENSNILSRGEQYFVTQINLSKEINISIRLSKLLIQTFLDNSLGKSDTPFLMENLTELEVEIITAFNDYFAMNIQDLLDLKDIDSENESVCCIVFYLNNGSRDMGKIILSIPLNILKPKPLKTVKDTFSIDDFITSKTFVDIKIGTSKIKLGEIKALEEGDILILDNSDIYKMKILLNNETYDFKISPDPSIILNLDNDNDDDKGGDMSNNSIASENLWDSIQVEIGAEFQKVQISLGELKQISEGLVVDIGSIYDNQITLKVEDKTVAKGELVIINDRYGIRVEEIINSTPISSDNISDTYEQNEDDNSEDTEDTEDEDFDYENIDDEDIV